MICQQKGLFSKNVSDLSIKGYSFNKNVKCFVDKRVQNGGESSVFLKFELELEHACVPTNKQDRTINFDPRSWEFSDVTGPNVHPTSA